MRILVTGGAGFVGSQYVRGLVSGGYAPPGSVDVTVLDKLTYAGAWDNLPAGAPGLTLVRGDVCDAPTVREVMRGHDAVVHFAAESHVDRSFYATSAFLATNVMGTQTLLLHHPHHLRHRTLRRPGPLVPQPRLRRLPRASRRREMTKPVRQCPMRGLGLGLEDGAADSGLR